MDNHTYQAVRVIISAVKQFLHWVEEKSYNRTAIFFKSYHHGVHRISGFVSQRAEQSMRDGMMEGLFAH